MHCLKLTYSLKQAYNISLLALCRAPVSQVRMSKY